MTRVQVRVIAPDEKTRDRAIRQLEAGGVSFTSPPRHPGRQGDWLAYGELDAEPAPDEPTRRRAALERLAAAIERHGPEYP